MIIIIIILSVCVFALFGDALTGPFLRSEASIFDHAFTVDHLGNIFFVRSDEQTRSLVALDSTGGEVMRADIGEYFGESFFVESLYVLQDKNIWITGYGYDPETLMIDSVKIASFREDGSYIEDIYLAQVSVFKDSLYRRVSSFDEDERSVYFAMKDVGESVGVLSIYSYIKDGSEPLRKIGEYNTNRGLGAIAAFHALPEGGVIVAYADGALVMQTSRATETLQSGDLGEVCFTRFWSGAGVVYMYDAVNGTLWSTPQSQLHPVTVISASQAGVNFYEMHDVSVSGVGNVLGVIHTPTAGELYLGGFTFLPQIASLSRVEQAEWTDWLVLIATITGIIIASVLIWEFFVEFMHMRMSMIIRQALLTVLIIFIAFAVLSEYVLVPGVTTTLNDAGRGALAFESDVLLASMKTGVADGSPDEAYIEFMEGFGQRYNTGGGGSGPLHAHLIAYDSNRDVFTLAASSDRYPVGIRLSSFLPYAGLYDFLMEAGRVESGFITLDTATGRQLAFMTHAGITIGGMDTFLCVVQNIVGLEGQIRDFGTMINTFLLVAGALLAFLLLLTVGFHVITLKRLNRLLHSMTLGRYDIKRVTRAGDETGEMQRNIEKLSAILRDKDASLKTLSTSYHRFIPERFLNLLGEPRVENVSKDMQTHIEGAYVAYLRFEVTGSKETDIFVNANIVLEHTVPAVAQYGGTVFGFTDNSFNGVFEKSAQDALSAALSARDACRRLNAKLMEERGISITLRVVLAKDDLTLGFIGDKNRMEPVAVADAEHTAESLMRICFDSNIYIAATEEFTAEIMDREYSVRRCGEFPVGGRATPFYEIYDSDPPALCELKQSFSDKFELGVNLFAKGDYDNAGKYFMEIIKYSTDDGVARNYVYLCEYNLRNADKQKYYCILNTDNGKWRTSI